MVVELVVCWVVTHTRADKLDYRDYKQFHGYVMKDGDDCILVNFYDDFKAKHINPQFNEPVQLLKENECSYE